MKRVLWILAATIAISAIVGGAVEARMNLNGTYAGIATRSCSVTNTSASFGIDASGAPTVIPAGGVFRQIATDYSTVTFNPDGTGTSVGQSHVMNLNDNAVGNSIFFISDFSTSFTYTVNADNTVDIIQGLTNSTTVLGAGTGNTTTVSGRTSRRQIGNGGNVLVGAPPSHPEIEEDTLVTQVLNDGTVTRHRICTRATTLFKLRGHEDD